MKDFPKNHPVTDYETFRPYVDSIVQGKANILTAEKPEFLATTSGTTGKAKRYPILKGKQEKNRSKRFGHALLSQKHLQISEEIVAVQIDVQANLHSRWAPNNRSI